MRMGEAHVFAQQARLELMEGELIDMVPVSSAHAAVVCTLDTLLREVAPRAMLRVQSPLVLGERSAPQPDVMLLRPRADRYYSSHPTAAEALLVVEVADTTLKYELEIKAPLRAGRSRGTVGRRHQSARGARFSRTGPGLFDSSHSDGLRHRGCDCTRGRRSGRLIVRGVSAVVAKAVPQVSTTTTFGHVPSPLSSSETPGGHTCRIRFMR